MKLKGLDVSMAPSSKKTKQSNNLINYHMHTPYHPSQQTTQDNKPKSQVTGKGALNEHPELSSLMKPASILGETKGVEH